MKHQVCGFEHLHRHSDFSLLDGFAKVSEYAEYQKTINQKFLCVTDHGVMGAVPEVVSESQKHNLFPLFGCELYINPMQPKVNSRAESAEYRKSLGDEATQKRFDKSCHLLAIAYNNVGYANLVRLTSWAWIHGYYRKPRINHEVLMEHKEGIIFTSGCGNSEPARAFFEGGDEAGFAAIEKYMAMFGEHFRLELMMLDWKDQKPYDSFLLRAHDKYHIPLILTQDCHYCKKEHSHNQRLMLMQQNGKTLAEIQSLIDSGEGADLFELQDSNLWLKSEDELDVKWEHDYQEVIDYELYKQAKSNTVMLAEFAKGVKLDREVKLPKIPNADDVLWDEIKRGFIQRGCPQTNEYAKRIKEEYELIKEKGFSSYFLIQKMMIDEARDYCQRELGFNASYGVGPGRGCLSNTTVYRNLGEVCDVSDIEVGDKVLTEDGSYQEVKTLFVYPVNEELLTVKSFYCDVKGVTMTKDHKVLVQKGRRPDGWEQWAESTRSSRRAWVEPVGDSLRWIRADEIEVGDWVFCPIPQITATECTWDLAKFDDVKANGSKLSSNDAFVGHEFNGGGAYKGKQTRVIDRYHSLDVDWACMLGTFTGDGWLRSNGQEMGFCFSNEERSNRDWVAEFFARIGCETEIVEGKDGKNVDSLIVKNSHVRLLLTDLFNGYKSTSQTKHAPDCIMTASEDIVAAYLHGYFLADGGEDDHKAKFVTTSYRLANQVRFLLLRLGIPSSLRLDDRVDTRERFSGRGVAYEITCPLDQRICSRQFVAQYGWRRVERGLLTQVRSIESVSDVKHVYDFEVANNHNYLTSSFLVHNSVCGSLVAYCLRLHDVEPIRHDLRFSRFLSPARGGKQMKIKHSIKPVPHEEIGF